ncbi:MAG: thioredoxin domain-containing protein [Acidobacteriota bacterium]|nr:MAG: thioredoxin domain-containing protein [Acidobacteriota bacterium]
MPLNFRFSFVITILSMLVVTASCVPSADAADTTQKQDTEIVAKIGETSVTRAELVEKAADALTKLRQQEYEILNDYLNRLVEESLLESAAAKQGKTLDEYVFTRIEEKLADPTDEQIQSFYDENKSRLRGQTLEQVRERIAEHLKNLQRQQLYEATIGELKQETKVVVLLEPPRVEVSTKDNPAIGPVEAPVTIVEFSDFQCPYCRRAEDTMVKVREKYGDKVRIVFRDFPLDFHRDAQKAHEAAGCAEEQGQFWAYHGKLFSGEKGLGIDELYSYAEELGLDMEPFKECVESGRRAAEVAGDIEEGRRLGVSGTPAFFVNGRFLNGAQPLEEFVKVIDDELARGEAKAN